MAEPTDPLLSNNSDDDNEHVEIEALMPTEVAMGMAINAAQFYVAALNVLGPGNELIAVKLTEAWTHAEHQRVLTEMEPIDDEGDAS